MADDDRGWAPLEPDGGGTGGETAPPTLPPPSGGHQWARPEPPAKAGDARTGPLPLHPMNLSDVLDGAFKLYKANFRTVVAVTAAFVVPVQLAIAFAQRHSAATSGFTRDSSGGLHFTSGSQTSAEAVTAAAILLFSYFLVHPVVAGAVSRVVAGSYLGQPMEPGAALGAAGRRWGSLVVAQLVVHVVEPIGFLLCILPGLMAMALFVSVSPAIVVEDVGPFRGLRRSGHLMRPRLFHVLGIALLAGLMALVLAGVLGAVPGAVAAAVGPAGWPIRAAGNVVAELLTLPFVAIVATLLYFDGRIRQEGFDLQIMAAELAR